MILLQLFFFLISAASSLNYYDSSYLTLPEDVGLKKNGE